jgi:hypothetical protein
MDYNICNLGLTRNIELFQIGPAELEEMFERVIRGEVTHLNLGQIKRSEIGQRRQRHQTRVVDRTVR